MRFNTSLIVLGFAAAVSAVPVSGPSAPGPNKAQSDSSVGHNPDVSTSANLSARDFEVGLGAALERREYSVSVTFKELGGVRTTAETEKQAEDMVKETLKNAAKRLKMGEGSELTVTFTNHWQGSFLKTVQFTFQDPVCGGGGSGTCSGDSKAGGQGTIMAAPKKGRSAKVLWSK
ncbi:hypothetical protein J3R30DRAFT_3579824, partial [Lentinula aciculospora]